MAETASSVPSVVLYCDESCQDFNARHQYMAIGGLWVAGAERDQISKACRAVSSSVGCCGEVKWSKTSSVSLAAYKALFDFFQSHTELRFRAIVVDQSRVQVDQFHGRDKELAFYKFYYEMLEKWLTPGNEYTVLLDAKRNRGAERYATLRLYLERHLRGMGWIRELTVIDSRRTPLAQLCDLLTGAVAGAYNRPKPGSPKAALIAHIEARLGRSLAAGTALSESKFNVFQIELR